jgi:hypothetical protein
MSWIDQKYMRMLSGTLELFRYKNGSWNFRCPICGDSEKNERKARGYLYEREGSWFFFCHNCGASKRFPTFLREINPVLYEEYIRERISDKAGYVTEPVFRETNVELPAQERKISSNNLGLPRISDLSPDHPARRYITDRHIPREKHQLLFYAQRFFAFAASKGFEITSRKDEPRLIIPLVNGEGHIFGFQGRSFDPNSGLRYITLKFDKSKPTVFGLDRYDYNQDGYVFEGPIDSLMLDNAIATAGRSLHTDLEKLGLSRSSVTLVYDNEKRNKHTVKKILSSIDDGWRVCVWPDWVPRKDVNDLIVKENWSPEQVKEVIDGNSSKGLVARLALSNWKRT